MKSIAIDFTNKVICIMTEGQQGTEHNPNVQKEQFHKYIPEKYKEANSFTWDFENETFSVNQDYVLHDGCIMTKDCFIPQVIIPLPGLKRKYQEFIRIMNYEEVNLKDEMPIELRRLLGLD